MKKVLSFIVALSMVLSVIPALPAFADDSKEEF